MKIEFLGAHTTESRSTRLSSLLIDDVLALDAGGLTSSLSFAGQLKIGAILLTHQHYDHIRDIPIIAMHLFLNEATVDVYSIAPVRDAISNCLLNGSLYSKFLEKPEGKPTIRFHTVEPYRAVEIEGYSVLAVPVAHSVPAVGYQVTSADGKKVFYTGDTGPGLADCWQYVSPQLLVIEVTASDRYLAFSRESQHLTPSLLREELVSFQRVRGYLPEVITVHMNPALEVEIEAELAVVARELGNLITLAYEGRQLYL
ncbi:MAG: MBL fold metallo-hydrolase [Dehalococcoidales bacterium]